MQPGYAALVDRHDLDLREDCVSDRGKSSTSIASRVTPVNRRLLSGFRRSFGADGVERGSRAGGGKNQHRLRLGLYGRGTAHQGSDPRPYVGASELRASELRYEISLISKLCLRNSFANA